MSTTSKWLAGALAAATLFNATLAATPALAMSPGSAPAITADHKATDVYWRRGGWGWGGPRWYGPGPGIAILGGVIIGGALVASAIAEHRVDGYAMRRCAAEFRSFDPRSGTYIDYNGQVRVCPYLY